MNLEYLKNLLWDTNSLSHKEDDVVKADSLKLKASEAIKQLFPMEFVIPGQISRLDFKVKKRLIMNGNTLYTWDSFDSSKSFLEGILEAKIDVLESREKAQPVSKEADIVEIISLKTTIQDLTYACERIRNERTRLGLELTEENRQLAAANTQVRVLSADINRLDKQLASSRKYRTAINWGGLAIAFAIGAGSIAIKVDFEKRTLQEKVDEQKITIDSLKKAHRVNNQL
jgi:hypothetical protein